MGGRYGQAAALEGGGGGGNVRRVRGKRSGSGTSQAWEPEAGDVITKVGGWSGITVDENGYVLIASDPGVTEFATFRVTNAGDVIGEFAVIAKPDSRTEVTRYKIAFKTDTGDIITRTRALAGTETGSWVVLRNGVEYGGSPIVSTVGNAKVATIPGGPVLAVPPMARNWDLPTAAPNITPGSVVLTRTGLNLGWSASALASTYTILKNGTVIASGPSNTPLSHAITTPNSGLDTYTVVAVNANGKTSAASNAAYLSAGAPAFDPNKADYAKGDVVKEGANVYVQVGGAGQPAGMTPSTHMNNGLWWALLDLTTHPGNFDAGNNYQRGMGTVSSGFAYVCRVTATSSVPQDGFDQMGNPVGQDWTKFHLPGGAAFTNFALITEVVAAGPSTATMNTTNTGLNIASYVLTGATGGNYTVTCTVQMGKINSYQFSYGGYQSQQYMAGGWGSIPSQITLGSPNAACGQITFNKMMNPPGWTQNDTVILS